MRNVLPATLVLCLAMAGCASSETTTGESSSGDCFYIRNISSWDSLDKDHVYIKEGVSKHYLATLFSSCPGLKFAQAIALSNHTGRMCPNDFGAITYRDAGAPRQCRIDNIEAVGSKEEAAAIAESRSE